MKKLSPRYRWWLYKRQKRAAGRRSGAASGVHRTLGLEGESVAYLTRKTPMPPILCFEQAPDATLLALGQLRHEIEKSIRKAAGRIFQSRSKHKNAKPRRIGTYRPFDAVKYISPAAALALAAVYERYKRTTNANNVVVDPWSWHPDVLNTLIELGFFKIFWALQTPISSVSLDTSRATTVLPMRSGRTADSVAINEFVIDLKNLFPKSDQVDGERMLGLYGSLIEAVVNVARHAYPQEPPRDVSRWWMTGAVNRVQRQMTAVVIDHGVTIPVSLANWERYGGWTRRMLAGLGFVPSASDPRSDGYAIAAAVEESASSTGDLHRGHGLAEMRDFVDNCTEGHLRIISRCGEVVFRPRRAPPVSTYDHGLTGTLIEWNVRL